MRSVVVKLVIVTSFTACALDFSMTPHEASVDGGSEDGSDAAEAGDEGVPDASSDGGGPFLDPRRWEVFDLRSVQTETEAGVEAGVSPRGAAVFDGRSLWVFPISRTDIAYRYEVDGGDFKDASSWSPVRTPGGSSAAYCVDDGHIYLASYDGRDPIVRYRAGSFPSGTFSQVTDGGKSDEGFSGTS